MLTRASSAYKALRELQWWLVRFRRLAALAPTRREGWRQTLVFAIWHLGSHAGRKPRRAFTMKGTYGALTVRDHSEMLVILEVMVDGVYDDRALPADVDLALDVGCNIGASSLWLAHRYPSAQIIGIEADAVTVGIASHNTSQYPNIRVVHAAISDHRGEETLWINQSSWASSTTLKTGAPINVPAVLIDDFVDEGGPRRILKIDVEGAEHAALRASSRLKDFEVIIGEYHPVPGESYQRMIATLVDFDVTPPASAVDARGTFIALRRT